MAGPSCRSSTCRSRATSSASEVSGNCGAVTCDPSAHAPCTRTMLGVVVMSVVLPRSGQFGGWFFPRSGGAAQFPAGRLGDLGAGEGVAADAPAAVGGLGDQHPGPVGERGVPGLRGDDVGELPDHPQLLVA